MRHIEFTQNLTQHDGKVVVIVDMREERLICLFHHFQVNAVVVFHEETLLGLQEDMIEHIFALGSEVEFHGSIEFNRCRLATLVHLLQVAARQQENVVAIHCEVSATLSHLLQYLHRLFSHIEFPKVVALLKRSHEIEFLAILRQGHTTQVRRHRCQADDTVL